MRTWTAGTTRAARRSVAPIAGGVTGGVAPIAPVDPNAHPEPSRSHDANPKESAKDQTAPNVSLAPGGSTFRATLLRAKRALSTYLSAHRTNAPGFEVNTVCLALWAECGECDALERYLSSRAGAFEVLPGSKSRVPPPYDADVVKDACRRNSRWHALAILLDAHGRRPRGERDETDAVETWRALANGEKRDFVSGRDGDGSNVVGCRLVGCRLGAATRGRRDGSAREGRVRLRDDRARSRRGEQPIVERMTKSGESRIDTSRGSSTSTLDARSSCSRTRESSRACPCAPRPRHGRIPACLSEPRSTFARGHGRAADVAHPSRLSDVDAKELHTKYAALVNAAGDRCATGTRRTSAFLSSRTACDAAVVARAIDPRGLTESDARGDLRGCKSLATSRDGEALRTDPCPRGFESHLVLLRRRLGDHAAAIRLILDVITHEGGVAGAEAAAEKYVERCQSGRAARRTVRLLGETDHGIAGGESRTGTWRGDGDADVTAALLNAYVRRSTPPRWAQAARVVSKPNVRVDVDGALAMLPPTGGDVAEDAEGVALFERAVRRRDAANRAAGARREAREAAEAEARSG